MKPLRNFFIALIAIGSFAFITLANAQEAPDVLIKRISNDVIEFAKADQEIHAGNQKRVLDLVEKKILPYVDFQRMTALAAGRYWRQASPEQQRQLIAEFRALLVYTYSGAISQIRDQGFQLKPMQVGPSDTEVEVRSLVIPTRGEPMQLSYRLEKTPAGWRIFDVNVFGAWLVQTYKGTFASEISKSGIDGLIKTLSEKNKRLAGNVSKTGVRVHF
jgi:phospholipid transport system substrate-binding protein